MAIEIMCVAKAGAKLPAYCSLGAAGADVYAFLAKDLCILPSSHALIPTGLSFAIPEGYEIQIRSRSGLALKYGVVVLNSPGTIDSDYRGEIGVILSNFGKEPFKVSNGDRIAQMIVVKTEKADFTITQELDTTERSDGGFGSTGNK